MAFKMNENDFNAFLGKIQKVIELLNQENVSTECKKESEKIQEIIDCFNDVRDISFQRKAAYENYIKLKDQNPSFAKRIYDELYMTAKEEIVNARKRLEEKLYER